MEARKKESEPIIDKFDHIHTRIEALRTGKPLESLSSETYHHILNASFATVMIRFIGAVAELNCEEQIFFKNFVSRREKTSGKEQGSINTTTLIDERPDNPNHYIEFKFDEQFTAEQARIIINFYQQLYKASDIAYFAQSGKLVFRIALDTFIQFTLEDMLESRSFSETEKFNLSATAGFTIVSAEEEHERNLPLQQQLINKAAASLGRTPSEINESEIFETSIVQLTAKMPGISAEEKSFFTRFDASRHASFRTEDQYHRTVITLHNGVLSQKQAGQLNAFYVSHFGNNNVNIRYMEASVISMYEPPKIIITLNFDVLMQKILPAIKNPALLLPIQEQSSALQVARYK